jgi:hypothetical protein
MQMYLVYSETFFNVICLKLGQFGTVFGTRIKHIN